VKLKFGGQFAAGWNNLADSVNIFIFNCVFQFIVTFYQQNSNFCWHCQL